MSTSPKMGWARDRDGDKDEMGEEEGGEDDEEAIDDAKEGDGTGERGGVPKAEDGEELLLLSCCVLCEFCMETEPKRGVELCGEERTCGTPTGDEAPGDVHGRV